MDWTARDEQAYIYANYIEAGSDREAMKKNQKTKEGEQILRTYQLIVGVLFQASWLLRA